MNHQILTSLSTRESSSRRRHGIIEANILWWKINFTWFCSEQENLIDCWDYSGSHPASWVRDERKLEIILTTFGGYVRMRLRRGSQCVGDSKEKCIDASSWKFHFMRTRTSVFLLSTKLVRGTTSPGEKRTKFSGRSRNFFDRLWCHTQTHALLLRKEQKVERMKCWWIQNESLVISNFKSHFDTPTIFLLTRGNWYGREICSRINLMIFISATLSRLHDFSREKERKRFSAKHL